MREITRLFYLSTCMFENLCIILVFIHSKGFRTISYFRFQIAWMKILYLVLPNVLWSWWFKVRLREGLSRVRVWVDWVAPT